MVLMSAAGLIASEENMQRIIATRMKAVEDPKRTGASHASIVPYGSFATSDGKVQLGIQNEREWLRFCESVLGQPDVATDSRFLTNGLRVERRSELIAMIEAVFAGLTTEQVIRRLDDAQIANARQSEIVDLIAHPQLTERDRWRVVDSPVGPIKALRPPAIIQGMPERMDPIPSVGQHTNQILTDLGFSTEAIETMRSNRTI